MTCLKGLNNGFISYKKILASQYVNWWTGVVDFCDVYISCLNSHSDGTHSLQRMYCCASDAKFLQICYDETEQIKMFV